MSVQFTPQRNPRVIIIQKLYGKLFNNEQNITFEKEISAIDETNNIENILNIEKTQSVNSEKSDSAEDFVLKQLKDK